MVVDYHLFTLQRYKIISILPNIYAIIFQENVKTFFNKRNRQFEGEELPVRKGGTGSSSPSIGKLLDSCRNHVVVNAYYSVRCLHVQQHYIR